MANLLVFYERNFRGRSHMNVLFMNIPCAICFYDFRKFHKL